MKKYIKAVKKANAAVLLLVSFFLAAFLELGVFQLSYFSQYFGDFNRIELDLSKLEGFNGEALPLLPENPTISFDGLSEKVHSVTIRTS